MNNSDFNSVIEVIRKRARNYRLTNILIGVATATTLVNSVVLVYLVLGS